MLILIKRNLLLYLRDKTSVFFSLLSVIIVIILYVLFLAELQMSTVRESVKNFATESDIQLLINTWIIAGLLSIVPITSSLGALVTLVADKERKIIKDFKSSPISIVKYPISAVISSCLIGIIMSVMSFVLYSIYIYINSKFLFTGKQYLFVLSLTILANLMAATANALLVSFFNTISSFTAASIVVGTVVGFITGVYVPLGILPKAVQYVIQALPFGHIAVLFRNILMKQSLDTVFNEVPVENLDSYKELYGIIFKVNGKLLGLNISLAYIVIVILIATFLFMMNFNRKRKEF